MRAGTPASAKTRAAKGNGAALRQRRFPGMRGRCPVSCSLHPDYARCDSSGTTPTSETGETGMMDSVRNLAMTELKSTAV